MYAAQLRTKPQFQHLKSPSYTPSHYSKMQTHQLENLKRELELKRAKAHSTVMRQKTLEYRDKINYQNELDRIRGYLSRAGPRMPQTTVVRLKEREKKLKELGAQITN